MIYLDHGATTPCDPSVRDAMLPFFTDKFENPSSIYSASGSVKNIVMDVRETAAALIGASREEIFFTSGGTEADNWALMGAADMYRREHAEGGHIITGSIEHPAILNTCAYLEKMGFDVTYLPVDRDGYVSVSDLESSIRPDTCLVSIMLANNEVGTIEPIKELAKTAHDKNVLFHTDAVQAFAQIPINVEELGIDMLSASAHKFYGPKGIGLFYVKKGISMGSFIHGGAQERGRRAGTENVPGIVGLGAAMKLASENMEKYASHEAELRDHMIERILNEIPGTHLNGPEKNRLPGNVSISFDGLESESLVIGLDFRGIMASAGSACSAGSAEPSHVLTAMGRSNAEAKSTVRFSIGRGNTIDEIDEAVDAVKAIAENMRKR
ncbi:cysteine desulfurase [Lachnospiraceae bacterium]|nr:cysteine desulfurase [Lachnospiraceae bacterium]